jgi:hypothetical protein
MVAMPGTGLDGRSIVAAVYKYLSALVFLAVVVQIGFAGYGAFSVAKDTDGDGVVDEKRFDDVFGIHAGFGYLVILAGLVLLVVALIGRHRIKVSLILAGLLIVQLFLAWIGYEVPWIGFFHPINAMVIAGLTAFIVTSVFRGRGAAAVSPATSPEGLAG